MNRIATESTTPPQKPQMVPITVPIRPPRMRPEKLISSETSAP